MIDPTKLVRSALLALALMFLAPLAGAGGSLLGVATAQAKTAPLVASVLFEGNIRFSDANLVAMIDTVNRGTADEAGLARDVTSITNAYKDVGFSAVQVSYRLEPVADSRVRVVFQVVEGTRAGIAAINFTGNNNVTAWQLKSVMRTKETGWLSWLLRDDNYTQEQLDMDRELIRQYYANHGFPDAQVTSAVAEYDSARQGYFISITVLEGNPIAFGAIGVETSIAGLDANRLTGSIRTREGTRFSAAELARSAQDMAVEATNLGYPFADVRPRVERDQAAGTFSVTYLVDEGQRLYVERVNITGNEKTRDFVIRRELPFAEGDPFNRALVTQGKMNIEGLGYFSRVNFGVEQGSASDKVVLNIMVEETSTGDYGITAGYDSSSGILGELSLTERNFLGRGQYLRAAVGASQTGKSFDFSFTEPYFMGLKMSAGIDLYHRITDETSTNVYGRTSTGGQLRFGVPLTRDVKAQVFAGLDRTIVDDDSPADSAVFADGDVFDKAWVGYSLTYENLDDHKKPTEGLTASLTQTYVGWDYNFLKTEAKARYFMPLNSDLGLVASLKAQGGIINNFSGTAVSSLETFTYGAQLVRGFTPGGMGPKTVGGEILGYTAYAGISAEVSFPIPMLPESYGLSGAIFADAGVIAGKGLGPADPASLLSPIKSSAGASIIWDSPFGPLRGDMAIPLTGNSTDTYAPQPFCSGVYCPSFALTLQTLL
ncbi:outer membrane protein assembly factor BamA [Devosia sp. 66-22]|uniref:outer membrane protein assembly factor BamA n=1 Tax=Devosia sp. 66-22 TaxID=1895753 RepID=UPI00092964BF|nr:outer membrane protein assembly factor BamA [Devosia sp. 66-22]OJX53707.1 MAG: outer membrane protein assembly factor BamA [Devosia sp. 66-22]